MTRLDAAATAHLHELMCRQVDEGLLPSCSAALALDGEVIWAETAGPTTPETRYVVFSATKAIVCSAVWQLLTEGSLALDQPVRSVLPAFGTEGTTPAWTGAVTVEDLLCHTGGFPMAPMGPRDWDSSGSRQARMARWRCDWEPGSRYEYHPVSGHWVLAELITVADGRDFREAIHDRVTGPLGLPQALGIDAPDSAGLATPVPMSEAPTAEEWAAVGLPVPPPLLGGTIDPADVLATLGHPASRTAGVPGGGGVMTPSDLALYYQGLLHDPAGLWDPAMLAEGTANVRVHFEDPTTRVPVNRTLGLVVAGGDGNAPRRGFGRTQSPRSFGHNGAGGQIAFADPDRGLSIVFATDGLDRHTLREWKRTRSIVDAAVACLP